MDDMERYGDYNEVDEPPRKSPTLLIIKIVAVALCLAVIALIGFRMFTFNYYPDSMKKLYFTPSLTAFYNERGGDIGAKTQSLRAPYDDADEGNFFCDNLIIIPDLGQLQVSLRYNISLLSVLEAELGLEGLDPEDEQLFTFRLWKSGDSKDPEKQVVGTLTYVNTDSFLMYRYYKLVFDGIDFNAEGEEKIDWIRLEVFVKGQESADPYSMIAIYENNEDYSKFSDYKLGSEEAPQ